MIFVAAGTKDGRELVSTLLEAGYDVTASVVSAYGDKLLKDNKSKSAKGKLIVNDKPLDEDALAAYLSDCNITAFVDATHPYAVNVSRNAMSACERGKLPYIRYERDITSLKYDKVHLVHSYAEATEMAAKLGKNIFLTTGSRNLDKFTTAEELKGSNIIARVLPTGEVVAMCEELGLTPRQIVALEGPFSCELNVALFKRYEADVIVTKNSGAIGGTDDKLLAAEELSLPVIVIDRPKMEYSNLAHSFDEVLSFLVKFGGYA